MASSRPGKTGIPTLIKSSHEPESETDIAFGRRVPKQSKKVPSKRSYGRNVKSLGSQDMSEENAMLRESLQKMDKDHRRMETELENTVKDANERLAVMKQLVDKRERNFAEAFGDVSKTNENLEEQVSKYEKKLISTNIDPVSLENMDPNEEEAQAVENKRKIAKGQVKQMREKLRDMNNKTQTYLDDLQTMKRQIEELEGVSSRLSMGGDSDDDEEEEGEKREDRDKKSDATSSTVFLTQNPGTL